MHKIDNKSKCDIVTESIINDIVNGVYPLESRLPTESELCEKYGVSRITIRESLSRLSSMGVISIQQGRGTFITSIDAGMFMSPFLPLIDFDSFDVTTIYDARLFVETGTCRLAARNRTIKDIEILKYYIEQMTVDYSKSNISHMGEIDAKFHIKIAEASGNQLLKASVINLERISKACLVRLNKIYSVMDGVIDQHREIAKAIELQDEDAAEQAIVKHTLLAKENISS